MPELAGGTWSWESAEMLQIHPGDGTDALLMHTGKAALRFSDTSPAPSTSRALWPQQADGQADCPLPLSHGHPPGGGTQQTDPTERSDRSTSPHSPPPPGAGQGGEAGECGGAGMAVAGSGDARRSRF